MRTRHPSSSDPVPSTGHRSVLLHEVIEFLDIQPDDIVVDATLGGGGHAYELLKGLGGNGLFVGFDLDQAAVDRAEHALRDASVERHLIRADFRHMAEELQKRGVTAVTKVLFDLGWSSYQLNSQRGFSFQADEPLRMTYASESDGLNAETIVNTWGESSLADIMYGFGEERYSRRIARAIVEYREKQPIKTARELADLIKEATPLRYRRQKIHPATRTFQALRIAVNDELGALSEGLSAAWRLLEPHGRIAVISFHSIEDRLVKRAFAGWASEGNGRLLTKKPITASAEEIHLNARSRSAKLRVVEKISHESSNTKN